VVNDIYSFHDKHEVAYEGSGRKLTSGLASTGSAAIYGC